MWRALENLKAEGQMEGFIAVYREYNFADDTMIQKLQEKFGLSYEEALVQCCGINGE